MPDSMDSSLFSALERFRNGEETSEDLHLISAAFASGQIEIIPKGDPNRITQSGGANFGESNEIRVTGSVIGTQIVSGITAEQVKEIIEDTREAREDSPEDETSRVAGVNILKIGGAFIGLIVIVLTITMLITRPPVIFPAADTKTPTPSNTPLPPTSTPTPTRTPPPPTATPTPTGTQTPTETQPPPTDTSTPTQTSTPTDIPLIEDDFSSNSKRWFEGSAPERGGSRFVARFIEQEYRLILTTDGDAILPARYWSSVPNVIIDNFKLSIEADFEKAPENTALLIGFHYDNFGSYYAVLVRPNLTYEIKLFLVDQDLSNPPPYFSGHLDESIFNVDGANHITIKVIDSKISIEFNDQPHLTEYPLPPGGPARGGVRLGVELSRVARVAIIDFDDILIHVAE